MCSQALRGRNSVWIIKEKEGTGGRWMCKLTLSHLHPRTTLLRNLHSPGHRGIKRNRQLWQRGKDKSGWTDLAWFCNIRLERLFAVCCACRVRGGGHLNSMKGQLEVALHLPFHSPESVWVCVRQWMSFMPSWFLLRIPQRHKGRGDCCHAGLTLFISWKTWSGSSEGKCSHSGSLGLMGTGDI